LPRKPKPSGKVNRGPFAASDVAKALQRAGAVKQPGGGHQAVYKHPTQGWKVPISSSWTGLRAGCPILNGITRTTGIPRKQLLRLLNGRD